MVGLDLNLLIYTANYNSRCEQLEYLIHFNNLDIYFVNYRGNTMRKFDAKYDRRNLEEKTRYYCIDARGKDCRALTNVLTSTDHHDHSDVTTNLLIVEKVAKSFRICSF